MISKTAENVIEIRVDEIAQLFHTLDPFPFREKDLDRRPSRRIVQESFLILGWSPIGGRSRSSSTIGGQSHVDATSTADCPPRLSKRGRTFNPVIDLNQARLVPRFGALI